MIAPPVGGKGSVTRTIVFAAATIVGAIATAVLLYSLGSIFRLVPRGAGAVALVASVWFALEFGRGILGRPREALSGSWIIPRHWGAYGAQVHAALFGFMMGLGWRTRVASNTFWLLAVASVLQPTLVAVLVPFIAFGVARALPIVVIGSTRSAVTKRYSPELSIADVAHLESLGRSRAVGAGVLGASIAIPVATYMIMQMGG